MIVLLEAIGGLHGPCVGRRVYEAIMQMPQFGERVPECLPVPGAVLECLYRFRGCAKIAKIGRPHRQPLQIADLALELRELLHARVPLQRGGETVLELFERPGRCRAG
jgi:hypothetical protein